ncbi:twin-arginine translocation signal domain-containing protein, partial [Nonomuraea rhizosphaerae]|uniref:twin-arginine translocation signal domain-containing protein n=1 Tax=Nonomuraea rhizosphaerae TaxID=2665663 RepID=UPI001C5E5053
MSQPGLSRRSFLTGVGAGAAALTLTPAEALAKVVTVQSGGLVTSPDRFGRVFTLPPFADFNAPTLRQALMEMGRPGGPLDAADPLQKGPIRLITNPELSPNNLDNTSHTAGVTFLGQFIDHDLTFDNSSPLGVPTAPELTPNVRTPGFDLDTVYGAGPGAAPQFYNSSDPAKLRLESG